MGYNVSHFFFDNSCATILGNRPIVSDTIIWKISFGSCDV